MTTFDELKNYLKTSKTARCVAVVWPADDDTIEACVQTLSHEVARLVMIGCRDIVENDERLQPYASVITVLDAETPDDAACKAVTMARQGEVHAIMKGLINTDNLLRAVLNKQTGILVPGSVLTHVSVAQIPTYDRLLLFSDSAVIPYPTHEQRIVQVQCLVRMCRRLGIETPRVALVHCSEKVNEKHFPHTVSYRTIVEMAAQGEFGPCVIDGPLDVKCACNEHSMLVKGIHSPLEGKSDALVLPDLEAGNVFYKTLTLFGDAQIAGILQGAQVPVIVPSRGDSAASKFNSIMLAVL